MCSLCQSTLIIVKVDSGIGGATRVRKLAKHRVHFPRPSQTSTSYLERYRGHFIISGNHMQEVSHDATTSNSVTRPLMAPSKDGCVV